MRNVHIHMSLQALFFFALVSHAAAEASVSPQAGGRTHAQNYKDMVLAECVATAYKNDEGAAKDSGNSASALQDWTRYDWEKHPYSEATKLVDAWLERDYRNPLVESEVKGVRFDFLKCLDLYHSRELDVLVRRVVIDPGKSWHQDNLRAKMR